MSRAAASQDNLLRDLIILISEADIKNRKDKAKLCETQIHKLLWDLKQRIDNNAIKNALNFYWYRQGPYSPSISAILEKAKEEKIFSITKINEHDFYTLQGKPTYDKTNPELSQAKKVITQILEDTDMYDLPKLVRKIYYHFAPFKFQPTYKFEFLDLLNEYVELVFDRTSNTEYKQNILQKLITALSKAEANLPNKKSFSKFNDLFSQFVGDIQVITDLYKDNEQEFIFTIKNEANHIWDVFAQGVRIEAHDAFYDNLVPQWQENFNEFLNGLEISLNAFSELVSRKSKEYVNKPIESLDSKSLEFLNAICKGYVQ